MKIIVLTLALFLISLTPLTAQWEIINEGFKGQINTIDYVNDNVGWIAGLNGTMLKTLNGGETWNSINLADSLNFFQIDFINESIGWVVGETFNSIFGGTPTIWKTVDGGLSWVIQKQGGALSFTALYVLNEQTVFASGRETIYKTTNGGSTWQNVTPDINQGAYIEYLSIFFINSQIGVIIGKQQYMNDTEGLTIRTNNGGSSWSPQWYPQYKGFDDLQSINDSIIYFIGSENWESKLLLETTNLGTSWSTKFENVVSYHSNKNGSIYTLVADSLSTTIFKSTNSGATWQSKNPTYHFFSQTILDPHLKKIYFNNNGMGFQVGELFFRYSGLFRSLDDGENWNLKNFSFPFTDISFFNQSNGILVGGFSSSHFSFGKIFSSNNNGTTWCVNDTLSEHFFSCFSLNETNGFIHSWGTIYKTTDMGNSWNIILNYDDISGFFLNLWSGDILFKNDMFGWAVGGLFIEGPGHFAAILGTTDSGNNWDSVWVEDTNSQNYNQLHSICSTPTNAWSVGDGGIIVKYTPQTAWVKQTSVTDLPLNKIFFTDDNHGWIAGGYQNENDFQNMLLKTVDGGASWSSVPNVLYLIKDIWFLDNNLGWAIGYDSSGTGGILRTTDGGNNWSINYGNLNSKLNALFIKDNYGWAVGDNGLILRTTDAGVVWMEDNRKTYPTEFALEQNYPNPFNPSTIIQYAISSRQFVTLKVYDVLGREVATLVNDEQPAGNYEVAFNPESGIRQLASGIYFYQLKAGDHVSTKKMLLLK